MAEEKKTRRRFKLKRYTRERIQDQLSFLSSRYVYGGIFFLLVGLLGLYANLRPSAKIETGVAPWSRPDRVSVQKSWSYFYPAWDDSLFWPFRSEAEKAAMQELRLSAAALPNLLTDPQKRLDPQLPITPVLIPSVKFWLDVYARYDSRVRIIHDRNRPEIVYGVLDFRSLHEDFNSPVLLRKQIRKIESQVLSQLQLLLLALHSEVTSGKVYSRELETLKSFLADKGVLGNSDALARDLRTQSGQKDVFHMALVRSVKLLPLMETIMRRHNLPAGLSRLPFVESSFNPHARSKVGAMGLWQFTPPTAREMIHPENKALWVHPMVQTQAAARLLRQYRKVLPDWPTTVTAYNSGVGRLSRLVTQHRAKNYESLYLRAEKNQLGFAGRHFYPSLMAASLVEAYKEQFFDLLKTPPTYVQIMGYGNPMEAELCLKLED